MKYSMPGLVFTLGCLVTASCASSAPSLTPAQLPSSTYHESLSQSELELLQAAPAYHRSYRKAELAREYRASGNSLVTKGK